LVQLTAEEAPAALLPWDTDFWGVRVGQVRCDRLDAHRVAALDDWAAVNEIDCLYFLGASDDADTAHAAERGGFQLMDLRVELRRDAAAGAPPGIRPATPEDREPLLAIEPRDTAASRWHET
jgi:hypothetical protein